MALSHFHHNEEFEQRVAGYAPQVARPQNADVRTENERCGTRQSKGATATAIWI